MFRSAALVAAVTAILGCTQTWAFGKAPPASSQPKTVVKLDPIQDVTIALPQAVNPVSGVPDAPSYDFGPNLIGALGVKMQNGHYILAPDESNGSSPAVRASARGLTVDTGDVWDGRSVVPSATFKFYVDALVFRTGGRGNSMYYGFDERFRTPYNDGTLDNPNEFPLSEIQFEHWFDRTFQDRGTAPFDSQSGLDLGQGFTLNALMAWIGLKYASYHSEIRMRVEMDSPLSGRHEIKPVQVKGSGYYFDIVGGYEQWSAGIGLARTDAMKAAFNNAFAGAYKVIDQWAKGLPLTATLYGWDSKDKIFLNTGINSQIPVGTKYVSVENPSLVFEVTQDVPSSGSLAKLDSGDVSQLQIGMSLVDQAHASEMPAQVKGRVGGLRQMQMRMATRSPQPVAAASVNLPSKNLPKANFPSNWVPEQNWGKALLDSIIQGPLLPYRIWRYFQYDQGYLGPDSQYNGPNGPVPPEQTKALQWASQQQSDPAYQAQDFTAQDGPSPNLPNGSEDWAQRMRQEPFAKQIGLNTAASVDQDGPVVAVIDSGVDYNHPALNERIWKNPAPFKDPDGNSDDYGWDFISGDPRPYDDGYHGTEIASVIVGIQPTVHIMPLKIFNPFGITSSAAIFGAFQYAVDHGAQIIVAAWATQKPSTTLEAAIRYARDHGVLVIVSAGDRGDDLSKSPSYPAVLSKKLDNVLTVTGVDSSDQLVKKYGFYANYDPASVDIAAPGQDILAATPRGHTIRDTSTSLAAAMVAGAVARNWAVTDGAGTYRDWIDHIKAQAQAVPGLESAVQGGLRLRIR